ncbi:MAG: STAS domain-containing protein [Mariprofundaceae bacterium]|nr:STAS domain-containing protein [Mariprofundaceae bacterium]
MNFQITNTASSLEITGEINLHTAPLLLKALQQHNGAFHIGLLGVSALDNAGVATLIEAMRLAKKRKVSIGFHHVPWCVHDAWKLAGVSDLFLDKTEA